MPAAFSAAAAKGFAVVQRTFGEAAVVRPMTTGADVDGRPVADAGRAVLTVVGAVFREVIEERVVRNPWDARTLDRLQDIGAQMTVKLPTGLAYEPVAGDIVERPGEGVAYSVIAPVARTRVNVTLGLAILNDQVDG